MPFHVMRVEAEVPVDQRPAAGWVRVRTIYFRLVVAMVLAIALASFVRDRGHIDLDTFFPKFDH
jgi:hypothetical protein